MGENSKIEWTDHTFNPWIGCSKVSAGCANCYAERYGERFGVKWGPGGERRRTSAGYWRQPLRWNAQAARDGERRRVFCASLADVFEDRPGLPAWRGDLGTLILATPHLDWLLLTKRPECWREACRDMWIRLVGDDEPLPPNVWLGTSVEDQATADQRIPHLLTAPAAVRFVSCEPLLGPVDLGQSAATCDCCERIFASRWLKLRRHIVSEVPSAIVKAGDIAIAAPGVHRAQSNRHGALAVETPAGLLGIKPGECEALPALDWVIVGGESGPGARPLHPDWARSLRDQCQAAGVPLFFKQQGEWVVCTHKENIAAFKSDKRTGFWFEDKWRDQLIAPLPGVPMVRVGKRAAGRLLDRREWNGFPEVTP